MTLCLHYINLIDNRHILEYVIIGNSIRLKTDTKQDIGTKLRIERIKMVSD